MDKCSGVTAIVEYDYAAKESDELDLVKGALIHSIKQMPGGWWEGTLQANGKVGMFPDNFVRVIDTNDESTVQLRNKAETLNRRCKVIFSYTQVNDDELSLAVGDVIEFLGEVEEGWWRGRLKNKVGVFPSNFVVAIEPSPVFASKRPPTIHATTTPSGGGLGGVTANKSAAAPTAATTTTVNSANASSASAAAVSTTTTTSVTSSVSQTTKKLNRLSMHNSKTDLLNATTTADAAMHGDDAPSLPPKPQREYCRVDFPYAPQNEDELELKVGDIIAIVSMELPDKGWWKGELRGKVGVFPDNFVKLLAPNQVAPLNDTQPTNRTAKTNVVTASSSTTGNATNSGSSTLSGNTNSTTPNTTTTTTHLTANNSSSSTATTKVFIKKSGSTASSNSNRKDSFGSRDSLNDILSETGLPSGNVAAQRKSLENKNFDLTNPPDASTRMGMKKTSIGGGESKSSTTINNNGTNDVRKSLENLDEKSLKTTPPPVLTKKPLVPNKKTTTVTSVAGNLLSGLKQKVKGVDSKLTTTVSHDAADGIGSSKMSPSQLPDATGQPGAVVMRRAATIAVEDSDFDRVERASILSDMRANRVKAPKRRPPSAAINAIGETNNNNSIYLNGSGTDVGNDDGKPQSSDDNSMGEDGQLAKPKPREWEKKKAPWMEELKASQVKKKTSPGVETTISVPGGSVAERTSKLFADEMKSAASSQSFTSSTSSTTSSIAASNLLNSTTKVQSSTISSSSVMQQSMHVESSSSVTTATGSQSLSAKSDLMSKSLSGSAALAGHQLSDDTRSTRPNSLALRKNSGASPSTARSSSLKGNNEQASNNTTTTNSSSSNSNGHHPQHSIAAKSSTTTSLSTTTTMLNNHHNSELMTNAKVALNADSTSNNGHIITSSGGGGTISNATGALRVIELEKRVDRLESVVQTQQRTIEDLVRTLREEKECVKLLRGELDKYAQCVTQV